jgi:DNA-binding NarL/FixJ family response regulator
MNTRFDASILPALKAHRFPVRTIRTVLAEDSAILMCLLARFVSRDRRISIVSMATDGRRAFCAAAALAPDLVITDLHMPAMDGAELTRRLKALANPPVVIVATSDETREARARCVAAGADAFLVKDGHLVPQLLATIQEFFSNHSPADAEDETVFDEASTRFP